MCTRKIIFYKVSSPFLTLKSSHRSSKMHVSYLIVVWCTVIILEGGHSQGIDPCVSFEKLPNVERRALTIELEPTDTGICDDRIVERGWVRPQTADGDQKIATTPPEVLRCGTIFPAWMYNGSFPEVNTTVDRIACVASLTSVCEYNVPIQIRNCTDFYVYKLANLRECPSAYCFGIRSRCPANTSSETGFTPGCSADFPKGNFTPTVEPQEHVNDAAIHKPITMKFNCLFTSVAGLLYDIAWYIDDIYVTTKRNLSENNFEDGKLMENDWKNSFKLGMMVKCAVRARFTENSTPAPFETSPHFYAGIKVLQDGPVHLKEGDTTIIHLQPSIPVGCSFGEKLRHECKLHLNLYSNYQADSCVDRMVGKAAVFSGKNCNITIESKSWNSSTMFDVKGIADNLYNDGARVLYLHLKTSFYIYHDIWEHVSLPGIKIIVWDSDATKAKGLICKSYNDPHMKTFCGKKGTWENQYREAEYTLYESTVLPISIHIKTRSCFRWKAKCNCGLAIRSYTSLFVMDYCRWPMEIKPVIPDICNDQHMVVHKKDPRYRITLPTGTIVDATYQHLTLNQRQIGINIIIHGSVIDYNTTAGLCGIIREPCAGEKILKNSNNSTNDNFKFTESWKVDKANSLFGHDYVPPKVTNEQQRFCTCPDKNSIATCNPEVPLCKTNATNECEKPQKRRSKRDAGAYQPDNVSKRMEASSVRRERAVPTEVWTDEEARAHCEQHVGESALASLCNEEVGIDPQPFVDTCVLDIKYTNSTIFTDGTKETFTRVCVLEAAKNETFRKSNSPDGRNISMMEYMLEKTCTNDCSGHGVCNKKGLCVCADDYIGVDCSHAKTAPPETYGIPRDGLCDLSSTSCGAMSVFGWKIEAFDIYCRLRFYKVTDTSQSDSSVKTIIKMGFRRTYDELVCLFPDNVTQEGKIPTGYHVSVGYDGLHFGEEHPVIIYDGSRYSCSHESLCTLKNKSTPVTKEDSLLVTILAVALTVVGVLTIGVISFCLGKKYYQRHKQTPVTNIQVVPSPYELPSSRHSGKIGPAPGYY